MSHNEKPSPEGGQQISAFKFEKLPLNNEKLPIAHYNSPKTRKSIINLQ